MFTVGTPVLTRLLVLLIMRCSLSIELTTSINSKQINFFLYIYMTFVKAYNILQSLCTYDNLLSTVILIKLLNARIIKLTVQYYYVNPHIKCQGYGK